jgi:hypothetical protein
MWEVPLNHGGSVTKHTVVVLLGWLGSHPKSLSRYEALYRKLNSQTVLTYIAPPYTIVKTVLSPKEPIHVPNGWPNEYCKNIVTVQDIAWNVLKSVHDEKYCDRLYIHAFSNGGCFVWEKIRQILLAIRIEKQNTTSSNNLIERSIISEENENIIQTIRSKLNGVVFDSCPISDLHRLPDALQYCTVMERIQVLQHCGFEYLTILTNDKVKDKVTERVTSYVNGLQFDPLSIKQLYLYGRDDPLAPASFIDEMIHKRKQHINDGSIKFCVWDKSQHCGHFIRHPVDYTNAIDQFLNDNNEENTINARSKL